MIVGLFIKTSVDTNNLVDTNDSANTNDSIDTKTPVKELQVGGLTIQFE